MTEQVTAGRLPQFKHGRLPLFDPGAEEHPAYLYQSDTQAEGVDGFVAVDDAALARFHETGYLLIHNAFTMAEVNASLDALYDLVAGNVPGFDEKGLNFEKAARDILDTLNAQQRLDVLRKAYNFVEFEPRLRDMAHHPRLLDVIARLMHDKPLLMQDMALLKPPRVGREKPWHQDAAYFDVPQDSIVVGAWIALDEALPENGCMYVIPGTHRQGPVIHFKKRDWQICDTSVAHDRSVVCRMQPGAVLLFHYLLHHGTPTSHSDKRRRSLQYHYRPASLGDITKEERLAIFGSEGKDVTC